VRDSIRTYITICGIHVIIIMSKKGDLQKFFENSYRAKYSDTNQRQAGPKTTLKSLYKKA